MKHFVQRESNSPTRIALRLYLRHVTPYLADRFFPSHCDAPGSNAMRLRVAWYSMVALLHIMLRSNYQRKVHVLVNVYALTGCLRITGEKYSRNFLSLWTNQKHFWHIVWSFRSFSRPSLTAKRGQRWSTFQCVVLTWVLCSFLVGRVVDVKRLFLIGDLRASAQSVPILTLSFKSNPIWFRKSSHGCCWSSYWCVI